MTVVTRPLVRWHGGKFRMADKILPVFPQHRIYVEPFGGGASMLLRKPRSHGEVYNDLDGHIVNLFRVARDHGEELCRRIELTPFAREEFISSKSFPEDPIEWARLLLVRSHMGHGSNAATMATSRAGNINTGFRSNARRRGSIPAVDWSRFPDALRAIINRLRGVVIENMDAFALIPKFDTPDSLFYVDPPYLPETRVDRRPDYRFELTEEQHHELAAALMVVKGKVVLSGYASPIYENLYRGWHRREFTALADGGIARTEVLWMNFRPAQEVMAL